MTTTDIDFVQLQKDGGFTTPQMDLISKYAAFCNVFAAFLLRFAAFYAAFCCVSGSTTQIWHPPSRKCTANSGKRWPTRPW